MHTTFLDLLLESVNIVNDSHEAEMANLKKSCQTSSCHSWKVIQTAYACSLEGLCVDVRRKGRTLLSVNLLVSLGNCVHFTSKVTDSCKRASHAFPYSRGYFIDRNTFVEKP